MGKQISQFQTLRHFFSEQEHDQFLWNIVWQEDWKSCPKWLGDFKSIPFGKFGKKDHGDPIPLVKKLVDRLKTVWPQQKFNAAFLQRQEKGQVILPHREPKNYIGYSVTGLFGDWAGGELLVGKKRLKLGPRDVLIKRCAVKGLPRPLSRMNPIVSGARYALTLYTIE